MHQEASQAQPKVLSKETRNEGEGIIKVQVTIELDENQRIAVGLIETGKFTPATREEVRSYVLETTMASVNVATSIVVEQRDKIAARIKDSLGAGAQHSSE